MNKKFNVLYVDDEVSNLNVFKSTFRRAYNIYTAESAKEGLNILDRIQIDLVLTDQRMPEINGVEFLKKVLLKYPEPNRILITAYTDFKALKDAVNDAKIFQYIQKPWEEKEIRLIIENALEIYYLKQRNIELTEKLRINNAELERLNSELLELDKLKFQFLKIISHEIRTPLNGLVGVTSLFKNNMPSADYANYQQLFEIMEVSTQRLGRFLLLAERITSFKANSYKVNPEVIDVKKVITEVLMESETKLTDKEINLELDLDDSISGNCYADKQLIDICLSEILDNAVKYSDTGGKIKIKTGLKSNFVSIEIIDQGPGFPEIVMKNLFKLFTTEDNMTNQGIGLDLALIKMIVEAHEGNISIFNNKDGGATVRLTFRKGNTDK